MRAFTSSSRLASTALFVLMLLAGGAGGLLGSIAGAAFGKSGLFAGGVVGGLLVVSASALLARRLGLIERSEVKSVAVGGACGFLAATAIAVNTLNSPVGPILSTLLIGSGGLAGRWIYHRPR